MCWEDSMDTFNPLIATNIRRDTIDVMLKSLHFTNNAMMPEGETDPFYKVRFL